MDEGTRNIILGIIGAAGGGLSVGWIAKLFFGNYIKTNDEKHADSRRDHKEISDKVSGIKTDIAVINTKLDLINGVSERVVILEQACNRYGKDLSAAHEKIRSISK